MEKEIVRISAKTLGVLALKDFCPRCFWLKLKMGFELPYQIFPGIFSSIDSYSKAVTWHYFNTYKRLPYWFEPLGEFTGLCPVPHHSEFNVVDKETGIRLTGVPDEIFIMANGKYFIIDYKTAKFTDTQDELLPMYVVQLNSYAYIFEKLGIGRVAGLALCYYEPQSDAPVENLAAVLSQDGFDMHFKAYLKKVELNPRKVVEPLFKVVKKYADMEKAPEGAGGCRDCQLVDSLIEWVK